MLEQNQKQNGRLFCDLLIDDCSLLAADMTIMDHAAIAITDGRITDILPQNAAAKKYTAQETISEQNKLWLPGLVDCHTHTGQQLLKGKVLDELPMIWTRIMLPFESTLTPEKMRLSAEIAALEMIAGGTTGFVDSGSYYMAEAGKIYQQSGLRGALSHSTMDQGNFPASIKETAAEALAQTDALYDEFHNKGNLKVFYSLRALMNCSENLIVQAAARAQERNTYLQAHMNEYAGEINYTLERYGLRPFAYLEKLGVLSRSFLAAHCLMLSAAERKLLAQHDVTVVHCPFSNCGKGVPDTPSLMQENISVALGTDGAAHGGLSLWNEMKIFRSVMNAVWGTKLSDPAVMPAKKILAMAFAGNKLLQDKKANLTGLTVGAPADMISLDWSKIHLCSSQNRINSLLECVNSGDVCDTIVNGKFLLRKGGFLTLDKEKIIRELQKFTAAETKKAC
ncbi:amidohydrolase family protein [uncultured Phascolarctobacterium sp.]|uniref:amidohydrolase family protein n=1 Tax=uncultured Phascolarctobacterium sp. TaxID=512296 RepID=UPI0026353FA9|nr:amidohydrolase family protein [uncultured Phascolarctobacterium sp.]